MIQSTDILTREHYGINHFSLFTFILNLFDLKPESQRVFFPSDRAVENVISESNLSSYEFADKECPKLITYCRNILSKKVSSNNVDTVLEKIYFHVARKIELQAIIGIPLASMSFEEFEDLYYKCV